jgi:hypothetical protein
LAILLLVGHWFEHPEAMGNVRELPYAITAILESLRPGSDFAWQD